MEAAGLSGSTRALHADLKNLDQTLTHLGTSASFADLGRQATSRRAAASEDGRATAALEALNAKLAAADDRLAARIRTLREQNGK